MWNVPIETKPFLFSTSKYVYFSCKAGQLNGVGDQANGVWPSFALQCSIKELHLSLFPTLCQTEKLDVAPWYYKPHLHKWSLDRSDAALQTWQTLVCASNTVYDLPTSARRLCFIVWTRCRWWTLLQQATNRWNVWPSNSNYQSGL